VNPYRLGATASLSQRALPLRPAGAPQPAHALPVLRRPAAAPRAPAAAPIPALTTEADDGR
jgi:hypothetical protein